MGRRRTDRVEPIQVRPVRPGDAPRIAEFFSELSPETVYYRYFSANRPSAAAVSSLACCDHRTTEVIVAEGPNGEIMGVVDCYRHHERRAEIGIVVADRYQSKGIGGRLLRAAADLLEAEGVLDLDGDILPENGRMRGWMRDLGAQLRFDHAGVHFNMPLRPQQPAPRRVA